MSNEQFKAALMRDRLFLKELYESNSQANSKRLLTFANDSQIVTLIKYLNLLSNGVIKIKSDNFEALEKRHLSAFKKHFERKAAMAKILQSDRKTKLKLLTKFCTVFPHLLAPLFKEP